MDLLGEHFGTPKRFSDQSPTRWDPNESFFSGFRVDVRWLVLCDFDGYRVAQGGGVGGYVNCINII